MKIKILEQDGNTLRFILSGTSAPFANAIRRIIMSEVPTMTIDDVMMFENTSVMFDEMITHRLGLVPLTTDLDTYLLPEECDCKSEFGCNNCRVSFTLNVEAETESKMVYSGDLISENVDISPVIKKIPIVRLAPNQRLKLEAYAKLGKGLEHAKWQPVSACTYKFMPIVKIDATKCDGCGDCVKYCPKKVFHMDKSKPVVQNEINCTLCMECIRHCPIEPPPIKISHDKSTFIFYIESTGSMPASKLVEEAAKILVRKTQSIIEKYKKRK